MDLLAKPLPEALSAATGGLDHLAAGHVIIAMEWYVERMVTAYEATPCSPQYLAMLLDEWDDALRVVVRLNGGEPTADRWRELRQRMAALRLRATCSQPAQFCAKCHRTVGGKARLRTYFTVPKDEGRRFHFCDATRECEAEAAP